MCRDIEHPTVGTTKGRDCWLVFGGDKEGEATDDAETNSEAGG